LARAGRYRESIEKFKAAISHRSDFTEAHLNLARTYLILNEPEEATRPAKRAIELSTHDLEAQLMLAQAYFLQKKEDLAKDLLDKLIRAYPKNHFLFMALGDIAAASQKWDEAILHYQKVTELNPQSDRAHFQLGRVYLFKEVAKLKPDMGITFPKMESMRDMRAKIGSLLATGGMELDQARTLFRKAIYLNPKNVQARLMVGLLAFYTACHHEADMEFGEALKLEPENGFLYMALGLNAQRMGQFDKASTYLSKAVELMPDKTQAQILQIFLEIEKKNYPEAIQKAIELFRLVPESKEELFKIFAHDAFAHVPWLISMLSHAEKDKASFCAQALSFISKEPLSLDQKKWQEWWAKQEAQWKERLRQEMQKSMPK
jgi:tetratricopeptide (TPR) repeat protein